jgi:hypothetical protein
MGNLTTPSADLTILRSWLNLYPVIPGTAEKTTKNLGQDCGLRPKNWTQDPHSLSISNEVTVAMNTSKDSFIQHTWRTLQVPVSVALFISGRTGWHEVRILFPTKHSKLQTRSWQSWPTVLNEAPRRVGEYGRIRVVAHMFNITLDGGAWLALRPGRFTQRDEPLYILDRTLCGPQNWARICGKEKNSVLPGIKPGTSSP